MKLLLYCTKEKPTLYNVLGKFITTKYMGKNFMQDGLTHPELNGKIVAECDYEVEEITLKFDDYEVWIESNIDENVILKQSCLDDAELYNYLGGENGDRGYAIHIKNLHIFDKPKELDEVYYKSVYSWGITYEIGYHRMHRAPRNMRYVYDKEGKEKKIIIPVSPQEMCRIANKEQTILVRRNVLKEMLNNE